MSLKYIHSTFFIVVVMFSIVYDRKINKPRTKLDIRNDSENEDSYYGNSNKKEREGRTKGIEDKTTSRSGKIVNTPLFFSDESKGEGESVERVRVNEKHIIDNTDTVTAMSHEYVNMHETSPKSEKAAKNSLFLKKHLKRVTEQNREEEDDTGEEPVAHEKRNNDNFDNMSNEFSPWSTSHPKSESAKKHANFLEKHLKIVKEPNIEEQSDTGEIISGKRNNDNIKTTPAMSNEYVKVSRSQSNLESADKHAKFLQKHLKQVTDLSKDIVTISIPSHRNKKARKHSHNKKSAIQVTSSKPTELRTRSAKLKNISVSPVGIKTKSPVAHDANHSEDEQKMQSEVLKADYLREAYLDACKVVIIRKCRRALRAVSKEVCSRGKKCPGNFKDSFRENGMNACEEQFAHQTTACRSGAVDDAIEARRIFTVAKDIKEPQTNSSIQLIKKTKKMNILRDRYEKACKKDSYKKCRAACKDASDKTCETFECDNTKKRAFKKSCKRRCKEVFKMTGHDSDSADDDEDHDSDDDGGSSDDDSD